MTFTPISAKCATHAVDAALLFLEIGASTADAAAPTAIATRTVRSITGKVATGRNARRSRCICTIFFVRFGLEGLLTGSKRQSKAQTRKHIAIGHNHLL